MGWFHLERVPEPEVMDEAGEVESYASSAAQRHLESIDATFLDHLLTLLPSARPNLGRPLRALDIGTGPGQIPVLILRRLPGLQIVAVDRSENMLLAARKNAEQAGVSARLHLLRADANKLPFPDGSFDIGLCNSVLHHARDPVALLTELGRVVLPQGALLLRDLRRPLRPLARYHLWRHGRRYSGLMRRLFEDSVRASYTAPELDALLTRSGISGARIFRFRGAHIGIERPAAS